MHRYFTIIAARKNSKGIKGKNLQVIGNKPLLQYTIEAALISKILDYTILSTDDTKAIKLANRLGLKVPFVRPKSISQEDSTQSDVISHALTWYKQKYKQYPDQVVLLQPTTPFRDHKDIDDAIIKFEQLPCASLISVCEPSQHPCDFVFINENGKLERVSLGDNENEVGRQGYKNVFFINGGIYISTVERFIRKKFMFDENSSIHIMNKSHSLDIDYPFDLEVARAIYSYNLNNDKDIFSL